MKLKLISLCITLLSLAACAGGQMTDLAALEHEQIPKWKSIQPKLKAELDVPKFYSLSELNKYANSFPYRSDQSLYGKSEYWAGPKEFMKNGGDCEDFAIFKYYLAKKSGLAKESEMRLVLVYDKTKNLDHAVLVIKNEVLDNQTLKIYHLGSSGLDNYRFRGVVNQDRAFAAGE